MAIVDYREDPLGAVVDVLDRLASVYKEKDDPFSAGAYREAKKALLAATQPPLHDDKALRGIPGISVGPIAKVIVEAATTGRCLKLEKLLREVAEQRAAATASVDART